MRTKVYLPSFPYQNKMIFGIRFQPILRFCDLYLTERCDVSYNKGEKLCRKQNYYTCKRKYIL